MLYQSVTIRALEFTLSLRGPRERYTNTIGKGYVEPFSQLNERCSPSLSLRHYNNTYNINKCDTAYMFFTVISTVIYKQNQS
jgi:hypothetical protein